MLANLGSNLGIPGYQWGKVSQIEALYANGLREVVDFMIYGNAHYLREMTVVISIAGLLSSFYCAEFPPNLQHDLRRSV